jgi:hypothetical protein
MVADALDQVLASGKAWHAFNEVLSLSGIDSRRAVFGWIDEKAGIPAPIRD